MLGLWLSVSLVWRSKITVAMEWFYWNHRIIKCNKIIELSDSLKLNILNYRHYRAICFLSNHAKSCCSHSHPFSLFSSSSLLRAWFISRTNYQEWWIHTLIPPIQKECELFLTPVTLAATNHLDVILMYHHGHFHVTPFGMWRAQARQWTRLLQINLEHLPTSLHMFYMFHIPYPFRLS